MMQRRMTVARIPPVITTVPAVIRPTPHQTLQRRVGRGEGSSPFSAGGVVGRGAPESREGPGDWDARSFLQTEPPGQPNLGDLQLWEGREAAES